MSEIAARMASEIAEAEQWTRASATAYDVDPDAAVARAHKLADETGMRIVDALARVRSWMGDEWMRGIP